MQACHSGCLRVGTSRRRRRQRQRAICLAALFSAAVLAGTAGVALWILGSGRGAVSEQAAGAALAACGCALAGGAGGFVLIGGDCGRCCGGGGGGGGSRRRGRGSRWWLRWLPCSCCLTGKVRRVGDLSNGGGSASGGGSVGGAVSITVTRSRSEENLDRSIETAILRLQMSRPRKSSLRVSTVGSESPASSSGTVNNGGQCQQQQHHVRFSDSDDAPSPTLTPQSPALLQDSDSSVFFIEADGAASAIGWEKLQPVGDATVDETTSEIEQMQISAHELMRRAARVSSSVAMTPTATKGDAIVVIDNDDDNEAPQASAEARRAKRKRKRKQLRKKQQQQQLQLGADDEGQLPGDAAVVG